MDGKVILTVFGVLLLLAAIFFFFKSFAGHEQRMQEEQRARIELERKKLEDSRYAANQPLTPEEIERRRKLAGEREKADAARKAELAKQRKEGEKERLEAQIEAEKHRAEEEKRRAEEQRLAEELRAKQLKAAEEQAEAERRKAVAAEEARKELDRKQQAAAALAELRTWMDTVLQQCATAFPVTPAVPAGAGAGSSRVHATSSAGQGGASAYRSPDDYPGFGTWSQNALVLFCKQAMNDDASRQEPVATAPDVFQRIGLIDDADALKELHQKLAAQVFRAQDAGASANKNQSAGRNLVSLALSQLDKLGQQERELMNQPSDTSSSGKLSNRGPTKAQLLAGIRAEQQKTTDRMRTQVVSYWKAMNESRGSAAAAKLLVQAKQLVADQLKQLGVEDLGTGTTAATSVPKPDAAYKVYVMNDGTEIKAYTVMKMGDQLAIKDETGQLKTVNATDVKEIKKP